MTAFGMGGERLEAAGLRRRGAIRIPLGRGDLRGVREAARALAGAPAAARGRAPFPARRRDADRLPGLPRVARRVGLRRDGVPLVDYVSPQVWAWRSASGRARSPGWRGHRHALSLRGRDLPAPGGGRGLRGTPAWSTTFARVSRRGPSVPPRKAAGAWSCCPGAGWARCDATGRRWPRPPRRSRERFDLEVVASAPRVWPDALFERPPKAVSRSRPGHPPRSRRGRPRPRRPPAPRLSRPRSAARR